MHHGGMRALLVGILALSFGCGGDGDTGADAAGGENREQAIAYCMEVHDLPSSGVPEEECCFVDSFTSEARNCDEGITVVRDSVDGCAYYSPEDDLFPHPDGDFIKCAFTACEPCE